MFSPALTDGALGDTLYFHSFKNPGLAIDIVAGKYYISRNIGLEFINNIIYHFKEI